MVKGRKVEWEGGCGCEYVARFMFYVRWLDLAEDVLIVVWLGSVKLANDVTYKR